MAYSKEFRPGSARRVRCWWWDSRDGDSVWYLRVLVEADQTTTTRIRQDGSQNNSQTEADLGQLDGMADEED